MQLTIPLRLTDSPGRGMPTTSSHSCKAQSMKSLNASAVSAYNMSQQAKSDSKSNQHFFESSISFAIEFNSTSPIQIQCENCHTYCSSVVIVESTIYTYISTLIMTLICLCWVPFALKNYFMKITHSCPGCDRIIGQYDFLNSQLNTIQ
ncbi:unnamed protein product (macronuclear) [Paramecium tetraurelia]|uniref:LITAF domain-containing protein n=1 Tax=Paramecium tetraurelia TaxID=5888 RepID=A0CTH6_PARTE|nr:uncharacterized protein GSPATT00010327001 [Paramecium tetraurelia]CAK74093.1 unnamed protein product [Paramecium tetraurelia]|eukprot:XP_001441490.1 hypothetical protein (macronuclear) [Paramecium tetraurelia strain d4-2]